MSLIIKLTCVSCHAPFAESDPVGRLGPFTCPHCGPDRGILDVQFDLTRVKRTLTRAALAQRPFNHWRYHELLPVDFSAAGSARSSLPASPIGWTPIMEAPRLAAALGVRRLRLKDEGRSASGSFKDRASSVGVARAMQAGFAAIACASTGNAASSLAHCAAAAGLACNIFVSRNVPEGKLAQLLAYGARVFKIIGSYAEAYDLCTQACEKFGWYNRNAAINPYLVEGKKSGGLELAEQCAGDAPDWVSCSVGDGCSMAGVHKGLVQMRQIGLIDWQARMLGVQPAGVAPIAEAYGAMESPAISEKRGKSQAVGTSAFPERLALPKGDTYADSINVPVPRNWRKAMNAIRDSRGAFVTVTDEKIMDAVRLTGRLAGVFAEPAAAAAIAGIAEARERGLIDDSSSVVAMITGNGLKDTAGAMRAVGLPHEIPPKFGAIAKIVEAAGEG